MPWFPMTLPYIAQTGKKTWGQYPAGVLMPPLRQAQIVIGSNDTPNDSQVIWWLVTIPHDNDLITGIYPGPKVLQKSQPVDPNSYTLLLWQPLGSSEG